MPEQPGDVERTCADIRKAQSLLGYSPQVSFEEGIARTADWYRSAVEGGLFDVDSAEAVAGYAAAAEGGVLTDEGGELGGGDSVHGSSGTNLERLSSMDSASSNSGRFRHPLKRDESDLELSSYVQKASRQVRERLRRMF